VRTGSSGTRSASKARTVVRHRGQYFDEHPSLPNYVTTAEDMSGVLAAAEGGRSLDDSELYSLLHERIHIPDGQACARAEAAIHRAIMAPRQAEAVA